MKGIPAEDTSRQRVMEMSLDRARAIERLAEPDHAGIGMDPNPEHVAELLRA